MAKSNETALAKMVDSSLRSGEPVYTSTDNINVQLNSYLHLLVRSLQQELEENLLAVYLFGSSAYGAYEPGTSDVDVYAIIHAPILDYPKLARTISHAAIPCPARKLEFVLFTKAKAATQTPNPIFEMNFNTGKDMADYMNLNARYEPRFWFLLDIAIGRDLGKSLIGPRPDMMFAAPKLEWIFECMIESLAWQHENYPISSDGILNACRELRYAKTSTWSSKVNGGGWVLEHYDRPKIVIQAMESRASKEPILPQDLALEFLLLVENELHRYIENQVRGTG